MIIDHIGFAVSDVDTAKDFFSKALAPLGITLVVEVGRWVAFGRDDIAELWFGERVPVQGSMHIAFRAKSRDQVRAFYQAALAAGGKDNGAPGVREIYHPNYYGAFVIGPDGHNIEAVCHVPEP